jgi:hypothetical protein
VIPCLAPSFGVIYPQNDYISLRHRHHTPINTTTVSLAIWKCFDISATPKIDGDNRDRLIPCLATRLGVLYPQNKHIRLRLDQPGGKINDNTSNNFDYSILYSVSSPFAFFHTLLDFLCMSLGSADDKMSSALVVAEQLGQGFLETIKCDWVGMK